MAGWFDTFTPSQEWLKIVLVSITIGLALLLVYIVFVPFFKRKTIDHKKALHTISTTLSTLAAPEPKRIGITVDFSTMDDKAIEYAINLGGKDAHYELIHIVESPNAILSEHEVGDKETGEDGLALSSYREMLRQKGYSADCTLGYGRRSKAISEISLNANLTLLVMGAHGHRGIKDLLFGETIDAVRHKIRIPLLVVK